MSGKAGGTVGAVAIDVRGRIAAGTSTGGYTGKRPGRVGDSALIGAGTYADSRLGGVSTTGHGEAFIRTVLAKTALDILKELDDPQLAAEVALDIVREEGRGDGGLILMDWRGRLAYAHSTAFMPVGWCLPTAAEPGPALLALVGHVSPGPAAARPSHPDPPSLATGSSELTAELTPLRVDTRERDPLG